MPNIVLKSKKGNHIYTVTDTKKSKSGVMWLVKTNGSDMPPQWMLKDTALELCEVDWRFDDEFKNALVTAFHITSGLKGLEGSLIDNLYAALSDVIGSIDHAREAQGGE